MAPSLAERLRDGTLDLHGKAERAGIMREMLRGRIAPEAYRRLLRNLHPIYHRIELTLDAHAGERVFTTVDFRPLRRTETIERDLLALHGADWPALPLAAPTTRYVAHLETIAGATPLDVLAHAYVRYLGDLSGGQIVRRLVAQALALDGSDGLAFYDFTPLGPTARLVRRYREALDALVTAVTLDEATITRLVGEARIAFERHVEIFEAIR